MINPEQNNKEFQELQANIVTAIQNADADEFAKNQISMANMIQNKILEEAKAYIEAASIDEYVMRDRHVPRLTNEEKNYYNEVISLGSFNGGSPMPATIFERVFENLKTNHRLLELIDFKNTTGLTEVTVRDETKGSQSAVWGTIDSEIAKELETAFKVIQIGVYKLSAFIPVSKSMLDLGPEWIDRYVVELLEESIAIALEYAIVAGDGKEKPIGMISDLEGSVVGGAYPQKSATALTSLAPQVLGEKVMAPLTKDGIRAVANAILVVNPLDYWAKFFGATTMLTADKKYVHGILPIPAEVVQSAAVPKGKMIAGIPRDYIMTLSSERKIEQSDHVRFLQDQRVYMAKQLAEGRPKDNKSFLVFDISNLVPSA